MKKSAKLKAGQIFKFIKSITQPYRKRSMILEIAPDKMNVKYKVLERKYFLYKMKSKNKMVKIHDIQKRVGEIFIPKARF